MNDLLPWLTLFGLGAFHGLNPAMGWLFAVALGMQEARRGAVLRALVPLGVRAADDGLLPGRDTDVEPGGDKSVHLVGDEGSARRRVVRGIPTGYHEDVHSRSARDRWAWDETRNQPQVGLDGGHRAGRR